MMPPSQPKAGVVGAGIAGLASAIALRRAGWDVEVFERSAMKHEVGAAITLMPVANAILDDWGFDFGKAQGVPNHRATVLHAGNLSTISHAEYRDTKQKWGHKSLAYHRVDLHQSLYELVTSQRHDSKPVKIKSEAEVASIDCEEGRLVLKSGENFTKDLLVIADGAHSHLYEQFTGQPDPTTRLGRSLYRILVNTDTIRGCPEAQRVLDQYPNDLPGFVMAMDPVDNVYMICYPCRDGKLLNFGVMHNTKHSPTNNPEAEKSWQTPSSVSEVLETTHNFNPAIRSMFELAKDDNIKIHHCMHRPPLNSFVRGKALLTGDAAHLMMPTHAAGASMAVESAGVLEVLMRDVVQAQSSCPPTTKPLSHALNPSVKVALTLYDSLRVPRCTAFQLLSNGGFMSQNDPAVVGQIRRHGFVGPLPGPTAGPWSLEFQDWYFSYDARAEAVKAINLGSAARSPA